MPTAQLTPASTVGQRIAQARRFTGMSQAALAAAIGVTRVTVTSWETGKTSPTVEHLLELAPALQLPATWFVEGLSGEFGCNYGSDYRRSGRFDQLSLLGGTSGSDDLAHPAFLMAS